MMNRSIFSSVHVSSRARHGHTEVSFHAFCVVIILLITAPLSHAQAPTPPDVQFDLALDTGGKLFTGSFLQDREGFFWIPTQSGLFKWDGYTLKKPHGSPDCIYALYEDSEGLLWVGASTGLSMYDKATGDFTAYRHDADDPRSISDGVFNEGAHLMDEDADGNIWFGMQTGLHKYDKHAKTFTAYSHDALKPNSLINDNVFAVWVDKQNVVWVGTEGGLDKLNPSTATFTHYQNEPENSRSLSHNFVTVLSEDRNGVLWVGTKDGGLNRFDAQSGTFTRYLHDPDNPRSISHNYIHSISEIRPGELWLTHYTFPVGVDVFNTETGQAYNYKRDQNAPDRSISSDTLFNVYRDRTGIIWLVHFQGILDKIDPQNRKFTLYRHHPNNENSLAEDVIWKVYQDQQGLTWILFASKGMDALDPLTNTVAHYPDIPGGAAYDMLEDRQTVWVTGAGGIYTFDKATGRYSDLYSLDCLSGQTIIQDRHDENILWVGTEQGGLVKFDKTTKKTMSFRYNQHDPNSIGSNVIWNLLMDKAGFLWLPTYGGGLDKFDPNAEQVVAHYRHNPNDPTSLGSDTLTHVYEDSAGRIWVGTVGSGLNRLNQDGTFTRYNEETGFLTNWVGGMIEDNQGFLWLGAKIGLIKFDPNTAASRLYTQDDGLQSNEFWEYPPFKSFDGELWVFGSKGLNRFSPDKLEDNPYQPAVYFTALTQGGDPLKDVTQAPERVKEITLDWQSNFFEFEVAALNFTKPEQNQYQYMLEGFDKSWYEAGVKRNGRYSGLPGGSYTLRVKGSNNDGVWSDQEAILTVRVIAPLWERAWFRLLTGLAGVGLMAGGAIWRVLTIKAQKRHLEKVVTERTQELQQTNQQLAVAKEKADAANRAKSEFLANMSHELRTPLNAIIGFAHVMLRSQRIDPEDRENLDIIARSGEHLLALINQVLDLSKIEAGKITLDPRPCDVGGLLDDVEDMFHLKAEDKQLQLAFERGADLPRNIATDALKLRQVLINLLNNALKFTTTGGVTVRVSYPSPSLSEGESVSPLLRRGAGGEVVRLRFEVEDTGPGIPPEEMGKLFEAFEQTHIGRQAQEGTGLGLPISRKFVQLMGGDMEVHSQVGIGTTFSFEIEAERLTDDVATVSRSHAHGEIALEPGQPRFRILIVDDKPLNRLLLMKLLSPFGFELREAEHGQDALRVWEEWEPHLIWMDMRMPGMDGYEATKRMKATPKGQATAIIAVTASMLEEERAVTLSIGCDDFLRKPFREQEIFDLLTKHLGARFVSEKEQSVAETPSANMVDLPTAFAQMPPELLNQFRHAADLCDIKLLEQVIGEMRRYQPAAADMIQEWVNNFEYEKILGAL